MNVAPEPLPLSASHLPQAFGRYTLFDFIGRGGMAEIYLARAKTDLGASRLCVVKEILPELAFDSRFSELLIFEAKLAAQLSHANVVQVFDLGRADDRLFIAMDYVEGFDLNDLLRRCSKSKTPLPFEFALRIIADTLAGLDYAHRRKDENGRPLGIVHRDVSPSNVLISVDGEVKLCDFGIAHANDVVGDASALDQAIKGKAGYMSPEHARGEPIDARADVFAAGILLWELIAGRRMYRLTDDSPSLIEQARVAVIPELPRRELPEEDSLRAIVQKALATNRDERYASAFAMLRDLDDYVRASKLTASPLRLGEWLLTQFGNEMVAARRSRERALFALDHGAPVAMTVLPAEAAISGVVAATARAPVEDASKEREEEAPKQVAPSVPPTSTVRPALSLTAVAQATPDAKLVPNDANERTPQHAALKATLFMVIVAVASGAAWFLRHRH